MMGQNNEIEISVDSVLLQNAYSRNRTGEDLPTAFVLPPRGVKVGPLDRHGIPFPARSRDPAKLEIGRAHVRTPVNNAKLVCCSLLEKTQITSKILKDS